MPKGRGSNVRRLGPRQRAARAANHLGTAHPFAIWWETHRDRQWKRRNPENFRRGEHPDEHPRRPGDETHQQAIDRQNRAASKRVAANAARKRSWL